MTTRTCIRAIVTIVGTFLATRVLAATAAAGEGMGLLTVLLLAFGAIVILAQAVPAAMLFVSMLKALFSPARRPERASNTDPAA